MKFSKETLEILKTFNNISANLMLQEGSNRVATISPGGSIVAEAIVQETFPCTFGIYDLNEFLGVLSLFNDPEIAFNDNIYCTITENNNSIKYFSSSLDIIPVVPKIKQFPEPDFEFDISQQLLSRIQRVSAVLKNNDFSIIGNGNSMVLSVGDKRNETAHSFASEIGTTDKIFKVNLKVDSLRFANSDYHVSIGSKNKAMFKSNDLNLVYYVAIEPDSTFEF